MECSYLNDFLGTIYIRNKWFCQNYWKIIENFTEEQKKDDENKMEPPRSQEIKRWELI